MAITTAIANSFKTDLLSRLLNLPSDTIRIALYTSSATLNKSTTAYSATNEVPNSGTYAAGGLAMTGISISISGDTAYIDWTDPAWTSATITARGCLIYDDTVSDKAMATFDFGADKTSTAGTFTIVFPAPGASAILTFA